MSNREALLAAAVTCLREKGYAHTTARDLVSASGTNLGAIGYHFGSKERLLNEALYIGYEEWLQQVAGMAVEPGAGLWTALEQAAEGMLNTIGSHRHLCVAFIEALAQAERSPELREQMAAGYELYRQAVAAHVRDALGHAGESDGDAMVIATLLIAQMDGLLIQWLLDAARLPTASQFVAAVKAAWEATGRQPGV
jgi:AcrR family transcriptional regulator